MQTELYATTRTHPCLFIPGCDWALGHQIVQGGFRLRASKVFSRIPDKARHIGAMFTTLLGIKCVRNARGKTSRTVNQNEALCCLAHFTYLGQPSEQNLILMALEATIHINDMS